MMDDIDLNKKAIFFVRRYYYPAGISYLRSKYNIFQKNICYKYGYEKLNSK